MARPLRIEFPGATYHITSRGNAKQTVFYDDRDSWCFLSVLEDVAKRSRWFVYAYCLMPNHYHLLVETVDKSLSSGMRLLNSVYGQRFNRNHSRVGHVLQGRFKSIVVDKEAYLLELARYIVLNPVRAGIASKPDDWKWSSYGAMMGKQPCPPFLDCEALLARFGTDLRRARKSYAGFVKGGLLRGSPWVHLKGIVLGDDEFVEKVGKFTGEKRSQKEIARRERFSDRPALEDILPRRISRSISPGTVEAICQARDNHGYSMKQIADFLGVHTSTLTKAIKRIQRQAGRGVDPTFMA